MIKQRKKQKKNSQRKSSRNIHGLRDQHIYTHKNLRKTQNQKPEYVCGGPIREGRKGRKKTLTMHYETKTCKNASEFVLYWPSTAWASSGACSLERFVSVFQLAIAGKSRTMTFVHSPSRHQDPHQAQTCAGHVHTATVPVSAQETQDF